MFGCLYGVLPFSVVLFGSALQCSAMFLYVRLCAAVSYVLRGVQRCRLPFSVYPPRDLRVTSTPGVNDTWYNMRRRIVTFISCVYVYAAFLSVTLFVCTNVASKVNTTRKMVPITGGSRLFLLEFSKTQ